MGTIQSTPVAAGDTVTPDQYNDLREDMLNQHNHQAAGGQGGPVAHGDTLDGAPGSTTSTHADMDTHIGAPTITDEPGGDQGVHGLPSVAYVAGSIGAQYVIQTGESLTDATEEINGSGYYDQKKVLSFPVAYDSTPAVFIMSRDGDSCRAAVGSVDQYGFTAYLGYPVGSKATGSYPTYFRWISIGVKS